MSIEQQYVHDVYDNIAEHFSDTRYCIWDFVKNFLENKSSDMKGIDIGCGNGKNMLCRKDLNICLEHANNGNISLPITSIVNQFYAEVERKGGSKFDTSSLLTRFD